MTFLTNVAWLNEAQNRGLVSDLCETIEDIALSEYFKACEELGMPPEPSLDPRFY